MKRRWTAILTASLLALCLLLSACGGSSSGSTMAAGSAPSAAYDEMAAADADMGWNGTAESPGETETGAGSAPAALRNAKVIYTGSMSLQTQEFETAARFISETAEAMGGYLESTSTYGEIGYRYADYTVRIPSGQFEAFKQKVGETCHVVDQSTNVQDITDAYVDTEARLATLRTKHDRLLALLEKADNMENIIALETALADTEYEIEQYAGTLRRYDSLVDFSTLNLYLREVRTLDPVNEDTGFGTELKNAFVGGAHGLVSFVRGLILSFAASWPFWVIVVIVVVVLVRVLRPRLRRRRERKNEWTLPTPPPQDHDGPEPPAEE